MKKGGLYLVLGDSTSMSMGALMTGQSGANLYGHKIWSAINTNYNPVEMINMGISGINSSQMVQNLSWYTGVSPDLVTIQIGMNDANFQHVGVAEVSTTQFATNLGIIINALRQVNSNVNIVLCAPNTTNDSQHTTLPDYRTAMQSVATSYNTAYCDFSQGWTTSTSDMATYVENDGVHPNEAGNLEEFNLLWPIIQSNFSTWLNNIGKT